MGRVKLYIAMSIDGFIADEAGGVQFLEKPEMPATLQGDYESFYNQVGATIMGYGTYKAICELSNEWPYSIDSYVYTVEEINKPNVYTTVKDLDDLITELKTTIDKDIWIVGGANMLTQFHNHNLIDEYIITVAPYVLGKGLSLFADFAEESIMELVNTREMGSYVELIYRRV